MEALLWFIAYVVVGGFLACLGVTSTVPSVTGKQMVGWAAFILFGVPALLMVCSAALGLNL